LRGDVFFFELSGDVSFDEGGFSDTAVSDEDDFEFGDDLWSLHDINFEYYYSLLANNGNL
jgi:hypothetical protein